MSNELFGIALFSGKDYKKNLNFDQLKTAIGDFAGKPILAVIKQVSKTFETFA